MDDVYELFRRGTELLEAGHHHQATIPLSRARDLAPDKTSIREALGRALFRAQRYEQAAEEFEAVIDRAPTNDYALFCLGRSLQMLGRHAEARKPLALAAGMQPGRHDYRIYRDGARAAPATSRSPSATPVRTGPPGPTDAARSEAHSFFKPSGGCEPAGAGAPTLADRPGAGLDIRPGAPRVKRDTARPSTTRSGAPATESQAPQTGANLNRKSIRRATFPAAVPEVGAGPLFL